MPVLGKRIAGTGDIAQYLIQMDRGHQDEFIHAFFLDEEHTLCWSETVARGHKAGAWLDYRQLISMALRVNSFSLIIAHNHPSGWALPSTADVKTTRDLACLCGKLGIELLDHIIVAQDQCFSFKAEKII